MKLYVAVVARPLGIQDDPRDFRDQSNRPQGDWSCFLDEDKDVAVGRALKAREQWERTGVKYNVLVGEIEGEVVEPVIYDVVPLLEDPELNPEIGS